jgi:hypothetical protein
MYIFWIFNNCFVLEDAGDYCMGKHTAGDIRLCREKRNVIWKCKEGEDGLI